MLIPRSTKKSGVRGEDSVIKAFLNYSASQRTVEEFKSFLKNYHKLRDDGDDYDFYFLKSGNSVTLIDTAGHMWSGNDYSKYSVMKCYENNGLNLFSPYSKTVKYYGDLVNFLYKDFIEISFSKKGDADSELDKGEVKYRDCNGEWSKRSGYIFEKFPFCILREDMR